MSKAGSQKIAMLLIYLYFKAVREKLHHPSTIEYKESLFGINE